MKESADLDSNICSRTSTETSAGGFDKIADAMEKCHMTSLRPSDLSGPENDQLQTQRFADGHPFNICCSGDHWKCSIKMDQFKSTLLIPEGESTCSSSRLDLSLFKGWL